MTEDTAIPKSTVRPFEQIPRMGFLNVLASLLAPDGGRVDMRSSLVRQYERCGPVVNQGGRLMRFVNLFGPDANRFVLMDRDGIFSARHPWMQIMGHVFPNGLLLRDGAEHKHHRKIMHEAFKRPVLRDYARRMNPKITEGLASWRDRDRLLAFDAFKELTLDLATSIFLGIDLGPESRRMKEAFERMVAASMSRVRIRLPGLEYTRGIEGREFMVRFLADMLEKKRADQGPDMFSRLCRARTEEGDTFADQEVIDHMVFLMMAAHDTTTSTLTSMAYELAKHPEWQERVREESRALGDDDPGFDEVGRLVSCTRVMQETLRLYPPLPVIPRVNTEAFEFGGFRVPKTSMVVVSPIHTHVMREWWSEPARFDPDRFSPERAEHERHTHSWIPFGGGPHMCLGRRFAETQVRLIMHQLVQRYRWSIPEGYVMPVQQAPISKPRDGLPIRLTPLD